MKFSAEIQIIGVNPYVFIPEKILAELFEQSGKHRGKIPVRMKIDGHEFPQTLVKYAGHWRLYLNMPMRKAAGKDAGDTARFELRYDPVKRVVAMHPSLEKALRKNASAKSKFNSLSPSRKLEIVRYIASLRSEESVERNVVRAISFLNGEGRFVGRAKP